MQLVLSKSEVLHTLGTAPIIAASGQIWSHFFLLNQRHSFDPHLRKTQSQLKEIRIAQNSQWPCSVLTPETSCDTVTGAEK